MTGREAEIQGKLFQVAISMGPGHFRPFCVILGPLRAVFGPEHKIKVPSKTISFRFLLVLRSSRLIMIILQLFIPDKIQATSNAPSITLSPSLVFPPDSSRSFSLIKKINEIPLDTGSSFAPPCQPCPTWAPTPLASISCGKAHFSSHMW